jgi:phage terminase large subunit
MSSEFNDIFMEEANEFTFEDFIMLKTRMSGEIAKEDAGAINQMFLSYNPKEPRGYINEKVKLIKDLKLIKSTYRDNPFLTTEYIKTLEDLKEQDESYYKIFTLGEYAEIKGHIYDKYEIIKNFPEADEIIYGLDFGFNHPTALVEVHIRDGNYYIKENLYRTGMTNNELINYLNETLPNKKREIYCDSAEPDRIEELYRKKFNVHKANKSVKDGIDYIKSRKIYIHEESINLIDEFKDYKWKIDTNGEIIDEPVKIKDDLCDAVRYAIYTRHKFEERIQGRRLTSEDIEKIEREYREIQNAGL